MQTLLPIVPNARARAIAAVLEQSLGFSEIAPEVRVVLGGDGTMLHAIHLHDAQGAFFGINCGNLGFLMNDLEGTPEEIASVVLQGYKRWIFQDFPCLQLTAEGPDGEIRDFAVNDVYVARETGQTVHLGIQVDGQRIVSRLTCDGLIASTPLGSTAYSFSAGGPAAHPLVEALQLTAICPHSPRLSPMVLPPRSVVEVEVQSQDRRPARVSVDGQDRGRVHRLKVEPALRRVRLCFLETHDFTGTLVRKILHP